MFYSTLSVTKHAPTVDTMEVTVEVIFTDDFSEWCHVQLMKNKSQVSGLMENLIAKLKNETRKLVKTIRSDNGGEYCSSDLDRTLRTLGIRHEKSAPYTPQQNGVAERENRTLVEATRSMIHGKGHPDELVGGSTYVCCIHPQPSSICLC